MKVDSVMCCTVCFGQSFVAIEYVTKESVRAPALRCLRCDAIHLDEAVARSNEERESVRLAKAERAASSGQMPAAAIAHTDEEATRPGV